MKDLEQVEKSKLGPEKCDKENVVIGRAQRKEQEP